MLHVGTLQSFFDDEIESWLRLEDLYGLNLKPCLLTYNNLKVSIIKSPALNESNSLRFQFYLTTKRLKESESESENQHNIDELDFLKLDAATKRPDGRLISLIIDIIMHPSFLTPIPFISVHDSTGSTASLHQVDELLDEIDGQSDSFRFVSASLLEVEHPHTSRPCWTIHGCGVKEFVDKVTVTCGDVPSGVTLLRWFSAVGPQFGVPISPAFFAAAFDRLTNK